MKVQELIEILQDMDPEAEVYVMAQPSWPRTWPASSTSPRRTSDETRPELLAGWSGGDAGL